MKVDVTSDINATYAAIMNYDRVDRFIVRILWGHFAVVVLLALTNAVLQLSLKMPSPFAWRVISGPEGAGAVLVALAAAALPTLVRGRVVSHYRWRIGITVALITYSYVLVFLSGGSIEMHFHFFMSMALLVVYADWRLGWVVLLMAGAHHGILNYVAPGWVYFYGRNDLAVLAHGLPVAATAIFTTLLSNNHRRSLIDTERRRQAAEALASVGRLLSETLDVEVIGRRITQGVRDVLGLAAVELHRLEPDSSALVMIAVCGTLPATSQRSTLDVSLQLKGRLIGILRLVDGPGRVFSDAERRTAELFADQAALALENARLYAEATRRQRDAEGLAAAARTLTGSLDEAEVARGIVSRARLLLDGRAAGLSLATPDGACLEVARTGLGSDGEGGFPGDFGITAAVVARAETVVCTEVATDFRLALGEDLRGRIADAGIHRVLGVPLRINGRPVGAITVADGESTAYSRADVTHLESFADQAALALENARLYRAQQRQAASEGEARAIAEASSRRFRDLVNDLDAIVWEAETAPLHICFISEHAQPILGYPIETWTRDPGLLERHIHPDDRARVMTIFNAATVLGDEQVVEYRALTAEGRVRWLRTTLRVGVGGPEGQPRVRGLTVKRRRLEEQVRQGQKLEAIGTLAGGIAHDFNNILSAVLGFSELAIREAGDRDKVSGHLSQVLTASRRARDLVQQILTFSRPQNQDQAHQPTDLKSIVDEVLKLMRAALPSTIEIQANVRTSNTTIRGVGSELHQVLMNLCTNAGHAMRQHGGRLEVGLDLIHVDADLAAHETDLAQGHYVKLSITDTGCGMDRTTLERIFEPFFTTKAAGEGTGLGLSVVHGIVRSHRGAIKVYSERGQGTNFDLYFPLLEAAAALEIVEADPPRGHNQHVLLVDDEQPLAVMGQAILERLGYRVTALTSSPAALDAFRSTPERFDVVITDQTMPKLTGTELASELRLIRPDIPIILISGHSVQADRERARTLGIAELLAKPSTSHALGMAVARVLGVEAPPTEAGR